MTHEMKMFVCASFAFGLELPSPTFGKEAPLRAHTPAHPETSGGDFDAKSLTPANEPARHAQDLRR